MQDVDSRTGDIAARPPLLDRFVTHWMGPGIAPNYWMLAFCVLIPLQSIYLNKVPKFGMGLNLLNLLAGASLYVWWKRKDLGWAESPGMKRVIIAFFCWWLLSLGVSAHTLGGMPTNGISDLKDMFIPYLMFFAIYHSVQDKRGVKLVYLATLLPLPLMFRVFRNQVSGLIGAPYDDNWKSAITGTFPALGSNEIAAFYATYTLLLVAMLGFVKDFKWRLAIWILIGMNFFCLMFAFSRGAYLAFIVGLVLLGWLLNPRKAIVIGLIGIIAAAPLFNMLPDSVQERFSSIFVSHDEMDNSALQRYVMWGVALDLFKENPVLGIGYHAFVRLNPYAMDTHNFYIKAVTEQGIIGGLLVLILIIRALVVAASLYRRTSDPLYRCLAAGTISCAVAIMVGNFFGDRFTHYPLIAYFWVYMALVEASLRLLSKDNADPSKDATDVVPVTASRMVSRR